MSPPAADAQRIFRARANTARLARRSRLVRTLTILLPLCAVAIITVIFAYSGTSDDGEAPLTFEEVNGGDASPRMEEPRLKGLDSENRPYLVTAASAVQTAENAEKFFLTRIEADLVLENDGWMFIEAATGSMDRVAERLELEGGLSLYTNDGLEMHTAAADIDLKSGRITTRASVELLAPMGQVTAGMLAYDRERREAVFSGGVTTIYQPASRARNR